MITKIISGGQTGADRGGLEAAIALNIPHGGWCPRGRKAEDGPIPFRYQLQETKTADYPERTRLNVKDSDATLIFTQHPAVQMGGSFEVKLSRGSSRTRELCEQLSKPYLVVLPDNDEDRTASSIAKFLADHKVRVLNVAGPRSSSWSGAFSAAKRLVIKAVMELSDRRTTS